MDAELSRSRVCKSGRDGWLTGGCVVVMALVQIHEDMLEAFRVWDDIGPV